MFAYLILRYVFKIRYTLIFLMISSNIPNDVIESRKGDIYYYSQLK